MENWELDMEEKEPTLCFFSSIIRCRENREERRFFEKSFV